MGIRGGERGSWWPKEPWLATFPWSRPLLNPELDQRAGAPILAIAGIAVNVNQLAGVIVKTAEQEPAMTKKAEEPQGRLAGPPEWLSSRRRRESA